jgi:hypothetical protein
MELSFVDILRVTSYMPCMSFDHCACMAQMVSDHMVYHAIMLGLRPLTVWVPCIRCHRVFIKMCMVYSPPAIVDVELSGGAG